MTDDATRTPNVPHVPPPRTDGKQNDAPVPEIGGTGIDPTRFGD